MALRAAVLKASGGDPSKATKLEDQLDDLGVEEEDLRKALRGDTTFDELSQQANGQIAPLNLSKIARELDGADGGAGGDAPIRTPTPMRTPTGAQRSSGVKRRVKEPKHVDLLELDALPKPQGYVAVYDVDANKVFYLTDFRLQRDETDDAKIHVWGKAEGGEYIEDWGRLKNICADNGRRCGAWPGWGRRWRTPTWRRIKSWRRSSDSTCYYSMEIHIASPRRTSEKLRVASHGTALLSTVAKTLKGDNEKKNSFSKEFLYVLAEAIKIINAAEDPEFALTRELLKEVVDSDVDLSRKTSRAGKKTQKNFLNLTSVHPEVLSEMDCQIAKALCKQHLAE